MLDYDRKFKESDRGEGSRSMAVDLKPQVLRIGHRKTSPNFFRVYKKSNGKFIRNIALLILSRLPDTDWMVRNIRS